MFGLSLSSIKWIAAGIAVVVLLAIVAGGYAFINHQIEARVNAAVAATEATDAAKVNAATVAQQQAEAQANALQEAATLKRLSDLHASQEKAAAAITKFSGSLNHDLANDPHAAADATSDWHRVVRLLECASGSAGSCYGTPPAAAGTPDPQPAGAGVAPRP